MSETQAKTANDKTQDRTRNSVLRQLAMLQTMELDQLREKWLDLFGAPPPDYKRQFLIKRLAWRIQELFYGGLSEPAKERLRQAAQDDPVATVKRNIPQERKSESPLLTGTRFVRIWNGESHEVSVQEGGFDYRGRLFASLSAVAREITGTRWNGKIFFGMKKSYGKKNKEANNE
jgi:hypothetical protein